MSERDPLWLRPSYEPTNAKVEFDLYCFSREKLDLARGSPAADPWCPTGEIPPTHDLGIYERVSAPKLFESITARPLGKPTLTNFETSHPELLACNHLACVEVKTVDQPDLGSLQNAWSMARWLVQLGAFAVYDDAARRWHLGTEVLALPTPRPQRWSLETSTVLESDGERMFHSRGMKKFGRPDVLFQLGQRSSMPVDVVGDVLGALQETLAFGRVVPPGPMDFEGHALEVVPYEPGKNAPDVVLENEGLLVRPRRRGFLQTMLGRA